MTDVCATATAGLTPLELASGAVWGADRGVAPLPVVPAGLTARRFRRRRAGGAAAAAVRGQLLGREGLLGCPRVGDARGPARRAAAAHSGDHALSALCAGQRGRVAAAGHPPPRGE